MAQYIDKSAVVAEIERRIEENKADIQRATHKHLEEYFEGYEDALVLFKEKFLDTLEMEEEPVSEDLEEAARKIATRHSHISGDTYYANDAWFFKKGAQWQKENLWKPADGEDLPEIDKEVIALIQPCSNDEHLRVVFAHRPNKYTTWIERFGEKKIVEVERYGKGEWNIPNVKWWLDCELPKMEE